MINRTLSMTMILLVGLGVTLTGCGGGPSQASPIVSQSSSQVINLGDWWVTLFEGGVGGNLSVTDGDTTLTGNDTINFGYGSIGQVGALHSTGSFRPLKRNWAHNIYSMGFGGTQFSSATVSRAGNDLLVTTNVGTTYRIQPALGGIITVSGAKICLVTSGSVALAQSALVDSASVSIPVGEVFNSIGTASRSFGVKGQAGVDSLVVFASGKVEAHNDNLGDANADDVYIRLVNPPSSYTFQMQ